MSSGGLVQAGFRERRKKKLHNVLSRQLPCQAQPCEGRLPPPASTATPPADTVVEEWLALRVALGPLPEVIGR